MKKIIACAGFLAAFHMIPANAADQGVKLGLEGYYKAAFGVIASDDDGASQPQAQDRRSHSVKQDVKLFITGSTTLSNGMEVGALVELKGQTLSAGSNGNGQIDDTIMYIKGGFGELRVGDTDDVRIIKSVYAPQASGVFSSDHTVGEYISFSNNPLSSLTSYTNNEAGVNSTTAYVEPGGTKAIYLSPSFNGFSFGASYTPDVTSDRQNNGGLTETDNDAGENSEAWSVAANYEGKVSGTGIMASLGYTGSNSESASVDDVNAWQAGVSFNFGAFNIGGSYSKLNNAFGDDLDSTVFGIAGTYGTGPYTIGLGMTHGEYEVTAGREPELDTYMLSGAYAMGAGITLDAALQYNRYDNDGSTAIGSGMTATDDYDSTAIMVGSTIEF